MFTPGKTANILIQSSGSVPELLPPNSSRTPPNSSVPELLPGCIVPGASPKINT